MTSFVTQVRPYVRIYPAFRAAAAALACVILLQPLFVGSLVFVRSYTDLEPIRRNIIAAYEEGVSALTKFRACSFTATDINSPNARRCNSH